MPPSHYEVLNVSPQASLDEIHRSFRAMALSCHPDKNLGDAQATSRFQVIQRAWAVLGDSDLRSAYDVSLAAISEGRISEEVDLDDMHFEDDDDDAAADAAPGAADAPPVERYSWPCRCGSAYIVRLLPVTCCDAPRCNAPCRLQAMRCDAKLCYAMRCFRLPVPLFHLTSTQTHPGNHRSPVICWNRGLTL